MPEYEYQEVTSQFISWNEPAEVEGWLRSFESVHSKFGETHRASVETDEGTSVAFYCPSMLASRLAEIPIGSRVKIVFTGEYTKSKEGRPVKLFRVFVGRPKE